MFARFVILLTIVALMGLAVGFLGALHPAADSLAVFRHYLGALLGLFAVILLAIRARRFAGIALAGVAVALWPFLPMLTGAGASNAAVTGAAAEDFSVNQRNLMFWNPDPAAVGRDILARTPDFVTLQEVSKPNRPILAQLAAAYPAQQFCAFGSVGGVAVASRWPVVAGTEVCAERDGLAAMQVETPAGPVWVISIHLHWPWPHGQASHAARLMPMLEGFNGPKIIGGDFNMVPWSHRLSRIAAATKTEIVGPPRVTLIKAGGWLRIPIDHVLVSGGQGTSARLLRLGSDHFGLLASVRLATP